MKQSARRFVLCLVVGEARSGGRVLFYCVEYETSHCFVILCEVRSRGMEALEDAMENTCSI